MQLTRRVSSWLILLIGLISSISPLSAQSASLSGRITDSASASVSKASVKLISTSTGVINQTSSNEDGLFLLPPVTPGRYKLTVEAIGFGLSTVENIQVEVGQSRTINVELQPKALQQSVTVEAAPPQLITQGADRGNVVENRFVENVPLNVRNPLQLINFAQGVTQANTNASGTNVVSQSYTNTFRINGNKGATTEILLDGAANTVAYANQAAGVPQIDAVREFRVLTIAYAPEYGRTSGGVASYAMASGTNAVHGTVFEFLRNSVLDSNGFNANRAGQERRQFKRNQFGYSVGGPVFIPKLYDGRNKTFFFTSYEGLRETAAGSYTGTVPTALERQGDFSRTFDTNGRLIQIYDPRTTRLDPTAPAGAVRYIRDVFANNVIPQNLLNTVGRNLMSYYPQPNQSGQGLSSINNYFSSAPTTSNQNRVDIKVDHQINDHHSVFGRWDWFQNLNNYPSVYNSAYSPQNGNNRIPGFNWEGHHTWTISPSFVFEHHLSYAHSESNRTSPNLGFDPTTLGFAPSVTATARTVQFPSVTASRIGGLGTQNGVFERNASTVWQYAASGSLLKGRHSMKFGFDFRQFPITLNSAPNLTVNATSNFTGGPNPFAAASLSGSGVADLLLGGATVSNGITPRYDFGHPYYAFYGQDDFRLTPKLTLTFGLRYNLELANQEDKNQYIYLDLASPSPIQASVPQLAGLRGGVGFVGTNGIGRRTQSAQIGNVDPRFGIAYQWNDKTVFRGGFGIFHHPSPTFIDGSLGYSNITTSNPAQADGVTPLFNLNNPFPGGLNQPTGNTLGLSTLLGQSLNGPLRSQQISYSSQWSLDVQRQLPRNFVVTLGYTGNSGVGLLTPLNLNQIPDSALALGPSLTQTVANPFFGVITDPTSPLSRSTIQRGQLSRPFPQFQNITANQVAAGHSSYHAMQLAIEKRFSEGLALLFTYTHSKVIDNVGEVLVSVGPQNGFQNNNCFSCDRSVSAQNIPDVIRLSFNYELPFGVGKSMLNHGWQARTLGGWSVGSFLSFDNGLPVAVTSPNNSNSFGGGSAMRPNASGQPAELPDGPQITDGGLYFNPAAFARTPAYSFGNVSRYLSGVRNPGTYNWDLLAVKHIAFTERIGLDFRTEFFNAFNRVQFAGPNTDITSASFGRIFLNQVNTPRQIQFGLKLRF